MRFRFTIRDLLWLTALVAVAWWVDHQYSIKKWSKVHYAIEGMPGGIPKVIFSRGDTVDGRICFKERLRFRRNSTF